MRRFFVLLRKELRELITAQMLVPLFIVILLFFGLGQLLGSSSESASAKHPVVVIDADRSSASALVTKALEDSGFQAQMVPANAGSTDAQASDLALKLKRADGNVVILIPAGFGKGLDSGTPQKVGMWAVVRNFSFLGSHDVSSLGAALAALNKLVSAEVARRAAPTIPLQMMQEPVQVTQHVVIGRAEAASSVDSVMSFVGQQTTFIPIVLFVVIIFAAQMIATAIATEKENKTLETLLSYPINRASLVTAKMVAAGLIALLSAGVYMAGMRSYMSGMEKGLAGTGASARAAAASEAVMRQLGLTLGAQDYLMLGLSLFAGILVALSMAIILGAFAESVKSVQAMLTPLMVLLLIPYFLTLFVDIGQLPNVVRWVVMAIPFTYPFLAGPNLFLGNYAAVWFGILYQLAWFGVLVFIAARIFSSDRILTMKLSLKRRKAQPAA